MMGHNQMIDRDKLSPKALEIVERLHDSTHEHSQAFDKVRLAHHQQDPNDLVDLMNVWQRKAEDAFYKAGGCDAFSGAYGVAPGQPLVEGEPPALMQSDHDAKWADEYRRLGGVKANVLAVNAYVKAANSSADYRDSSWRSERREASKKLRVVIRHWHSLLEEYGEFQHSLYIMKVLYYLSPSLGLVAHLEFLYATGMVGSMEIAMVRSKIGAGVQLDDRDIATLRKMTELFDGEETPADMDEEQIKNLNMYRQMIAEYANQEEQSQ